MDRTTPAPPAAPTPRVPQSDVPRWAPSARELDDLEVLLLGGYSPLRAPIAPYAATRAAVRAMAEEFGGFLLVHVSTPLEVCEARDRKGLYAKARAGHLAEFTGVSDPYEVPVDADFTIDTAKTALDDAVEQVLAAATARGWLTALPSVGRTQPE